MSIDGAVVTLLSRGAPWAAAAARALQAGGAELRFCGAAQDLLVALRAAPDGVLVIADVGDGLSPAACLQAVHECAQGAPPPVLLLVAPGDDETPAAMLRDWGVAALRSDASPAALLRAVGALAAPARAACRAEARARAGDEELRAVARRRDLLRASADDLHHDVRTLLAVILGHAANLRDGVGDGAERAAAAGAVVAASLGAAGLLDRFQEGVREALAPADLHGLGPGRGARSRVDLTALLDGVVALFAADARARGITLAAAPAAPVLAWCERDALAQVLLNVVSNALKFTPRGGAVTCEARLIATAAREGERATARAELVVRDTGPGIPPAERARVFERGERGEGARTAPGAGLGLAICRELMTQHRGDVEVEDAPGGGALLRVSLPVDPRARLPSGVLLVEEPRAVEPFLDALMAAGPEGFAAIHPAQREAFQRAAAACEAVVLLPRGRYGGVLDAVIRRARATGASRRLDEPASSARRTPP